MLARRRRRAGIPLAEAGITLKTRLRYFAGLQRILDFVRLALSWADLDDRIAAWIERQWELGESIGIISDSLCGLTFYLPAARHQVPECWRLFRTWRKAEIPNRAPPIPAEVLWGLISACPTTGCVPPASWPLRFTACSGQERRCLLLRAISFFAGAMASSSDQNRSLLGGIHSHRRCSRSHHSYLSSAFVRP